MSSFSIIDQLFLIILRAHIILWSEGLFDRGNMVEVYVLHNVIDFIFISAVATGKTSVNKKIC